MIYIDKQIGETPLAALQRFRADNPSYADARLSYAGRLDPMASGKILLLEGEENDRRGQYLERDKAYDFQVLFGLATDTFDLLGLVTSIADETPGITKLQVEKKLARFVGSWQMTYPPYSSKTVAVDGEMTPLWQLARIGQLPEELPEKSVEIYEASCGRVSKISPEDVLAYVKTHVPKVVGDFRQEATLARWGEVLSGYDTPFLLADCRVACSSGTYVRRLADELGKSCDVPSLAFSITRTAITADNLPSQNKQPNDE